MVDNSGPRGCAVPPEYIRVAMTLLLQRVPPRAMSQLGYEWQGSELYELYLERVDWAGGFRAYEKRHLAALVSTFAPKFSHLPEELVGVVMMFYAHVGFY